MPHQRTAESLRAPGKGSAASFQVHVFGHGNLGYGARAKALRFIRRLTRCVGTHQARGTSGEHDG